MKQNIGVFICMIFILATLNLQAQNKKTNGLSKSTRKAVKKAIDKGVNFLRSKLNKDGHFGNPGITALALTTFTRCHRKYGPEDGPWIRNGFKYLAECQKADGGIYIDQLANYNTCVALMAFSSNENIAKEYKNVIEKAKRFILKLQCDEGEGYTPTRDKFYGGIGYGGDQRPDLSNTQFALQALKESGLPSDHPAFKKAVVFLQRCQNRSERNDQKWAGNDGGFVYYPGNSKAGKIKLANGQTGYHSYGSMTYAGIKSYIYANLTKDDPRVKAAINWIKHNYDLSENPGVGQQGLFYYYLTFSKPLSLLNISILKEANNNEHNWREELAQILLARQESDGSWQNINSRWWEANPTLVTSYVILSLTSCME